MKDLIRICHGWPDLKLLYHSPKTQAGRLKRRMQHHFLLFLYTCVSSHLCVSSYNRHEQCPNKKKKSFMCVDMHTCRQAWLGWKRLKGLTPNGKHLSTPLDVWTSSSVKDLTTPLVCNLHGWTDLLGGPEAETSSWTPISACSVCYLCYV